MELPVNHWLGFEAVPYNEDSIYLSRISKETDNFK